MLKHLGRLKRTRSLLVIGFAGLLAVSLIFFYAPNRAARDVDPTRNTETVARVGRENIAVADLALRREGYQQMLGGQISLAQLGGNKRFLDELIRERVISQEAARLQLAPSDVEVADRIRKQFTDASGQFIGLDRYKEIVVSRYGDIERFERMIRDAMAMERLKAFVTASVRVSDEEVQEDYKRKNTAFDLTYITIAADNLAERIQPSEEDLRTYYEQNKELYRIHEPQKKVRYVFIDQSRVGQKLAIPEEDLKKEYEALSPEFKQFGVRVQQIVLRVARNDLDTQVEQKARELVAKARGASGGASEQAFAELARGNSEDPATAKNGGFLAAPVRRNPNKPHELYDRALDMQQGEVTDPIRYGGDWYILRRGESVPKTFEQAREELLVSLRNRRAYDAASNLAERAQNRLQETKDPQKVAQEFAAEANMSPGDMVKETSFVKPGDDVPNIGSNQQFEQALAPLNEPNEVGQRTGVKGGFAIPILVDKRDPRVPEFDEVRSEVTDVVKKQRARDQLEQKAREIAAGVSNVADLKAVGEREGFEIQTEEDFKLGVPLGTAGTSPVLDESIYALKSGEITRAVKVGENWVIAGATQRTEADLAEYAQQREQLTRSMMSQRQDQVFDDYISAVQERMRHEGSITIYNEVLARMEEDEPPVATPRFPFPTE